MSCRAVSTGGADKLKSTYIVAPLRDPPPDRPRAHSFNQRGGNRQVDQPTRICRTSLSAPSRSEIRRAFVAPPGTCDFCRLFPDRCASSHMAAEPASSTFRSGEDIHDRTSLQCLAPTAARRHELRVDRRGHYRCSMARRRSPCESINVSVEAAHSSSTPTLGFPRSRVHRSLLGSAADRVVKTSSATAYCAEPTIRN